MSGIKIEARFERAAPSDRDPLAQHHRIGVKVSGTHEIEFDADRVNNDSELQREARQAALEFAEQLFFDAYRGIVENVRERSAFPTYHSTEIISPITHLKRELDETSKMFVDAATRAKEAETRLDELRRVVQPVPTVDWSRTNAPFTLAAGLTPDEGGTVHVPLRGKIHD